MRVSSLEVTLKRHFVFIPGKNWSLSLAELLAFLEFRRIPFRVHEFSRDFFEFSINSDSPSLEIDDLGGIIKIGVVKESFQTRLLDKVFSNDDMPAKLQIKENIKQSGLADEILTKANRKLLFGVSVYCADRSLRVFSNRIQRLFGSLLKDELTAQGTKSNFIGFSRSRAFPQLTHVEVLKKKLLAEGAEVLVCIGKEQTRIATTAAVHNPFEFQKRDVGKPVERRIFAISPRLARIMVNLAGCMPGKTFLDPFCGVGAILQEALLSGARVVGVDLNPWCVKASRENLAWIANEYELKDADFTVLQGDARKLSSRVREIDCMATEPDLGPALRHVPTNAYASRIVAKLEPLYFDFLEDALRMLNLGGRLVIVTPYFQTRSRKEVTNRFAEKAVELGFKRVFPFEADSFEKKGDRERVLAGKASLVDIGERHKVGREIHIFQR